MARTPSTQRLSRILTMVPWVIAHPDEASVQEVCARFDIDRATLLEDLDLLFMCGLPPFEPGDLIEVEVDNDHVTIRMADYLARPLRLTRWEAMSLLAAGRGLRQLPGGEQEGPLSCALDKLARAIAPGEQEAATRLAERIAIELDPPPAELIETLRSAIEQQRTVRMEYYSFGRDALTTRTADPWLVFGAKPWYLLAHDHASQERRTFRVDRIRKLELTDDMFQRPDGFDPVHEATAPLYHPAKSDSRVVLEVAPTARWVAEITPSERVEAADEGWTRITLRAGSTAWLARLALQLGDQLRIVEPVSLAEQTAALAAKTLALYQPADASPSEG